MLDEEIGLTTDEPATRSRGAPRRRRDKSVLTKTQDPEDGEKPSQPDEGGGPDLARLLQVAAEKTANEGKDGEISATGGGTGERGGSGGAEGGTAAADDESPAQAPGKAKRGGATRSHKPDNDVVGDIETGLDSKSQSMPHQSMSSGPMRVLEPLRTDPVKALQARQRRLERLAATSMPEVHMVGQIVKGFDLIADNSEGACCRWTVEFGKAWHLLGGETVGQTQVAYPRAHDWEHVTFNHPLDLHFAQAGLQGWGGPRLCVQGFKMDSYGRRVVVGYGFAHLPLSAGFHSFEVRLWRPVGSPEQEVDALLLGRIPALVSGEPVYESAWRERCRLVTMSAGVVHVELFVMTRFLNKQGIDAPGPNKA